MVSPGMVVAWVMHKHLGLVHKDPDIKRFANNQIDVLPMPNISTQKGLFNLSAEDLGSIP